jgi:glycosyltransferase involved in cell wall biosynthesis
MSEIADRVGWDFYFVCPRGTPLCHKKIKRLEIMEPSNKFQVRFSFEWTKVADALSSIINDIDLVLVNQPEQSANFYALMRTISDRPIPIITYFHYLPLVPDQNSNTMRHHAGSGYRFDATLDRAGMGKIILYRNLESIFVSESIATCSNFSRRLIEDSIYDGNNINCKCQVIPPPVATNLVSEIDASLPVTRREKRISRIIYNHRLYDEYGTAKIIECLQHYYNHKSKEFVLIVTDPTNCRSPERDRLDPNVLQFKKKLSELPFVEFSHAKTQREYFELIKTCDLGLGPMKPSAAWSMAVIDVMACGKPVLCPNYAAFPEMINTSELLYSSIEEFEIKLTALISKNTTSSISEFCQKQAQKFSIENCAARFINLFEEVSDKR